MNHKREQLCAYINRLIDSELTKPDANMELIDEYHALLERIERGRYLPSSKVKRQKIKTLNHLYADMLSETNQAPKSIFPPKRIRYAIVCVVLLAVMIPFTVAAAYGYSPAEFLAEFGQCIVNLVPGDKVEMKGFTMIRAKDSRTYDNIEDCLKQEELDIYYPGWLPEGTKIEAIHLSNFKEGDQLVYKFSSQDIMLSIYLYPIDVSNKYAEYQTMEIENKTVYYREDGYHYRAEIVLDDYLYCFSVPDLMTLNNLITEMRKG